MRVTPISPINGCCCECNDTITVDSIGGCSLQGTVEPNGMVSGSPGCFYRRADNVDPALASLWELWYKDSGVATTQGWTLMVKLA